MEATEGSLNGTSKGHYSLKAHTPGGFGRVHKIDSLTPVEAGWRIKARVIYKSGIRTYSNPRGEGKLFVVTLTDDSAEIKAIGFNNAVDKLYELLEVNKVYYFSKASLKPVNKLYTTIQNDYEMDFNTDTIIEPCDDDNSLPRTTKFNFVKFNELNSKTLYSVVDVIGVVKTCADVTTTIAKQKETTTRDLQIVDQSGMSVSLTLWGTDAQQFDGSNHPVIAVKGAKVLDFVGGSLSATPFSQIVHNPNLQEGHMLKDWFEHDGHNMDFQGYRNDGMRGGGGDSEISHEQLEEYMRTGGKTTVRHALGVVVGCGGAGKTTLLHRLIGKNDNEIEEIESTRGLEIHEHIFVVKDEDLIVKDDADSRKRLLGVSRCALESNKKNSHPVMDYSTAKGNIKNIDALESNKKNSDPAMDYSTTKGNIKNKNDDPAKNTVSTNLNPEGTSKETCLQESEKNAMKDILQTVQDWTTVSMIDFAGQFAYYACHQIYMRSKAFFILVLDINQSFKENGEHDIGCKEDSYIYTTWNSNEYTEFWLNSIKSFGGENAPVLLVLTHTEGKSDEMAT